MNIDAIATRIYSRGFRPQDFTEGQVKENEVIVRPVRPPDIMVGLVVSPATSKLPGTACLLYEVVAKGFIETEAVGLNITGRTVELAPARLDPDVGDVVTLRTAHLEPLLPDLSLHAIKAEHLLHIMPKDADGYDETQPEAHISLVRTEDLAPVIPFPVRQLSTITLPRNNSEAA